MTPTIDTTIALIESSEREAQSLRTILEPSRIAVDHYKGAQEALDDLTEKKYPLILINPHNIEASGEGASLLDAEIRRILGASQGKSVGAWNVGLYVIKKLREDDSTHREIPIVVVTYIEESGASNIPDAEQSAMKAGATGYINLMRYDNERLCIKLLEYLGRRAEALARSAH